MPETAVESLSMNELPAEPDRSLTDEQLISMLVNRARSKTAATDVGPMEVRVPREVTGMFEFQLVRKRQRRLSGVDEMVLSLA